MRCIALLITLLSLSLPCGSRKQRVTVFITTYIFAQDIPLSYSLCRCYAWGYLEPLHAVFSSRYSTARSIIMYYIINSYFCLAYFAVINDKYGHIF